MTDRTGSQTDTPGASRRRIDAIDMARGIALIAMAIYHLTWDLEFFGYVAPGTTAVGGWKLFARSIASSFLVLVGLSLFLGHAKGIKWSGYWRRMAMVVAAALAISLATYLAMPGGFIFFGILHQIALASVLGLAFLRLPALMVTAAGVAIIAFPFFFRFDVFNDPWWWWLGLSTSVPRSNDYVPLFPFFGVVLLGMALAKFLTASGALARIARMQAPRWTNPLLFIGRHSLAFYLIHQPVLIACVWLFAQIMPAAEVPREALFQRSCEATCSEQRDAAFCSLYCVCVRTTLERDGAIEGFYAGVQSAELTAKAQDAAAQCTMETDNLLPGGGQ